VVLLRGWPSFRGSDLGISTRDNDRIQPAFEGSVRLARQEEMVSRDKPCWSKVAGYYGVSHDILAYPRFCRRPRRRGGRTSALPRLGVPGRSDPPRGLLSTGCWDGFVRVWQIDEGLSKLQPTRMQELQSHARTVPPRISASRDSDVPDGFPRRNEITGVTETTRGLIVATSRGSELIVWDAANRREVAWCFTFGYTERIGITDDDSLVATERWGSVTY